MTTTADAIAILYLCAKEEISEGKACQILGWDRVTFREIRDKLEYYGFGLIDAYEAKDEAARPKRRVNLIPLELVK